MYKVVTNPKKGYPNYNIATYKVTNPQTRVPYYYNSNMVTGLLRNAFDDEGIASIVEGCPQLEVLLLDRAEYWSDLAVMHLVEGLPSLHRLRVRSSVLLSDRALEVLQQSTQQFRLLEILGRPLGHVLASLLRG